MCSILFFSAPVWPASEQAAARNSAGAALFEQGKVEAAIVEFQKALATDPSLVPARLNLAFAYERAGRFDDAIAAYREAIEAQPRNFLAHNNLGVLYDKKGKYELAIAEFQQALAIEPGNAMAQKNLDNAKNNRAVTMARESQLAGAEKAVAAKPNDPRASYAVARLHAVYGNKDLALQWLEKALRQGYWDRADVRADPAFQSMRGEREFELLLLNK
jgi:tetratricopeptide (TPR) repeat protein